MPNQPKTPARTVRIPDDEWDAVKVEAEREGTTATGVVRKAIRQYLGAGGSRGRCAARHRLVACASARRAHDGCRSRPGRRCTAAARSCISAARTVAARMGWRQTSTTDTRAPASAWSSPDLTDDCARQPATRRIGPDARAGRAVRGDEPRHGPRSGPSPDMTPTYLRYWSDLRQP